MSRDPALVKMVQIGEFMNPGAYRRAWERLSFLRRLWYTLKGNNPGGRKGAPSLKEADEFKGGFGL